MGKMMEEKEEEREEEGEKEEEEEGKEEGEEEEGEEVQLDRIFQAHVCVGNPISISSSEIVRYFSTTCCK